MVYLSTIEMITEENKLHDTGLVREVILKIFDDLKSKYGFLNHSEDSEDNYEISSLSIKKDDLVICALISRREAYEISVFKKNDPKWKSKNWNSFFFAKFSPFSFESKKYLEERNRLISSEVKYSYQWYFTQIMSEIEFLEDYYPQIFSQGII